MPSSSSSSDEDAYGPALPPHLLKQKTEEKTKSLAVIGPSLPPGFKSSPSTSSSSASKMTQHDEPDEKVDPLPTKQRPRPVLLGPHPPASTSHRKHEHASNEIEDEDENQSRNHDEEDADDDDDDVDIGPYPPDHPKSQARHNLSMARSGAESWSMGNSSKGKPKREEWMLIPPKNKPISNLALAPRKFLTRSLDNSVASDAMHRNSDSDEDGDGDAQQADVLKQEFQAQLIHKRDELMSNLQAQSESGAESLLESHRKKLSKKRKLEEEDAKANKSSSSSKVERRAFDRDTDLQISRMSADDKKRFINRATSELQGRFSHSRKTGKFL